MQEPVEDAMLIPTGLNLPYVADKAVKAGRLWRAKEHLGGRLGGNGADADLLEAYGWVLLQMRDDLDAGRYLFASGRRCKEYEPAIELFLSRHGSGTWGDLVSALPGKLRHCKPEDMPPGLAKKLQAMGMPSARGRRSERIFKGDEKWSLAYAAHAVWAICWIGLLGFLLVCLVVGIYTVADWLIF